MLKEQKGKKHLIKIEHEPLILKAGTMIDPATGWFEIAKHDDKHAITAANIMKQTWLNRCPWPDKINLNRAKEFIGKKNELASLFFCVARFSHQWQVRALPNSLCSFIDHFLTILPCLHRLAPISVCAGLSSIYESSVTTLLMCVI